MGKHVMAAMVAVVGWAFFAPAAWMPTVQSQATTVLDVTGTVDSSQICPYRGSGNYYQKTQTITLTAGNQYTLDLRSTAADSTLPGYHNDCDTYMYLVNSAGAIVAENDDVIAGGGAGGTEVRSLIEYIPTVSGTYTIVATSWAAYTTYPYHLVVTEMAVVTTNTTGALTADPNNPRGPGFNSFRVPVTLTAGQVYQIDVTGVDGAGGAFNDYVFGIDTYVYLVNSSNVVIAQDDNSGGGYCSRITLTAPATGTYTVVATSYAPGQNFAVQVTVSTPESDAPPPPPPGGIPNVRLSPRLEKSEAPLPRHA